ncbi:MAG: hypothetical protein HC914_07720 [Chloroflexaceae bacterium]|nr:hypothetical protein [Chloroflexaceae bacterium]
MAGAVCAGAAPRHRTPAPRAGLWLALSTALVMYTSFYHALFAALFTVIWLLYHMLTRRSFWRYVGPWLVALPVLALLLLPLVPSVSTGVGSAIRDEEHWRIKADLYHVDLVDPFLPSAHHPLWGAAIREYQEPLHLNSDSWVTTPGYLALALAILGVWRGWRVARLWLLLTFILLVYAMGTRLRIGGIDTGIPLPIAYIHALPLVGFGHRRSFVMLLNLIPFAVLVGFGVHALAQHNTGWRRLALLAAVFGLALFELAPPRMQIYADDTPALYASLRGGEGALLTVPSSDGTLLGQSAGLRAQMIHERPLIAGYVARPPVYPMFDSAPPFKQLYDLNCRDRDIIAPDVATARSSLAFYGVGQVVLHSERLDADELRCARRWLDERLALPIARQEGPIIVYNVPHYEPQPFLYLNRGWFNLERNDTRQWRWMSTRGLLYIVNPANEPRHFAVTLHLESFQEPRAIAATFNGRVLGSMHVLPNATRRYELLLLVPPGEHELRLSGPTTTDPAAGRAVSIVLVAAHLHELP